MILRRFFTAVAVLALTAVAAVPVAAHTELEQSEPAAGATLDTSPPEVFLQFTERIMEDSITIRVTGPGGDPVDVGDTQSGARAAAVDLPPLTRSGRYTVRYEGQSEDGHDVSGRFRFRLRLAEEAAPATEAATEPAEASDDPSPASAALDDAEGTAPPWAPVAAVVAILAVGATLLLLRARQSKMLEP